MYPNPYTRLSEPVKSGKTVGKTGETVLTADDVRELMKHLTTCKILLRFVKPAMVDQETLNLLHIEEALLDDFVMSKGWVK